MQSLNEFIAKLRRKPGLIYGDDATSKGTNSELESLIRDIATTPFTLSDLPELLDELSDTDPLEKQKIEEAWIGYLKKSEMSLDLPHLAKAGWSACVSATKDLLFETVLTTHLETIPSSKTVTIVDCPEVRVPPRSIPIYKLYGNLNSSDPSRKVALSASETLIRHEHWSALLRDLPDRLKGAPVVFIGVPKEVTKFVLSSLASKSHPKVNEIYYIDGDPAFNDPTVKRLSLSFSASPIDTNFRDLCNALAELRSTNTLSRLQHSAGSFEATYSSIVSIISSEECTVDFDSHRNSIIDALFRPKSVDWTPYKLGLDLQRTVTDEIYSSIVTALDDASDSPKIIFIRGEAAVGKTVTAKHVAVKLSENGVFVAWARSSPYNWAALYRDMLRDISRKDDINQLVIFCDDPHSLKLDPSEIFSGLEELSVPAVVVVVTRNTDFFGVDSGTAHLSLSASFEVPIDLNDDETSKLPSFLHALNIVESIDEGNKLVGSIGTRAASDILCSLWYLVPATKSQIADSLRDQYMRLGESEATIQSVAENAASTSHVAKLAYEYVTACSSLNVGLPIEVLVRALQIDYQDWIDMCVEGRPLWGLLYDEVSDDGDTIEYWTRNEVVTHVLLDLLNGGTGNAGQLRALGSLIQVCNEPSPVYRNFITNIL
ncbi:MAG: ATP-binding protein, partial [Candidatus Thiodiazotropha sp.]